MKISTYLRYLTIAVITLTETSNAQTMSQRNTPDHAELSKLNAQFIKNFINQDTVSHTQIIHQDFVCIQGNGAILNRNDYMKGWATGYKTSKYRTFDFTDEYIRIFGNVALVRSKTVYTKEDNGQITRGSSVYTDTYFKDHGKWLCIQAQITPVK